MCTLCEADSPDDGSLGCFGGVREQYANGSLYIVMIKEEPVLMHQCNIDHENIGNDGNEGGYDKTIFVLILFIFDPLQEKKGRKRENDHWGCDIKWNHVH